MTQERCFASTSLRGTRIPRNDRRLECSGTGGDARVIAAFERRTVARTAGVRALYLARSFATFHRRIGFTTILPDALHRAGLFRRASNDGISTTTRVTETFYDAIEAVRAIDHRVFAFVEQIAPA